MEQLGNSLTSIAYEKAGIAKHDVPHVIGSMPAEASGTIVDSCRRVGARPVFASRSGVKRDAAARKLFFRTANSALTSVTPALLGQHQLRNAQVAIVAALEARSRGIRLSATSIRKGLRTTVWAGRFQVVQIAKRLFVFDVAHNVGGARVFAQTWRQEFGRKRYALIVGFVKKKEHQVMADLLARHAEVLYLVPLPTHRSMDPNDLAATLKLGSREVTTSLSAAGAIAHAIESHPNLPIAIVGSHYLVGELLAHYKLV